MFIGNLSRLAAALVLGLGIMGGAAHAATVNFDFSGTGGGLGPIERFVSGGVSLEVTSVGGAIRQNLNGLGVAGTPADGRIGSDGTTNESLTFTFAPEVTLLSSVVLEHRDGIERFEILDGLGDVLETFEISGRGTSLVSLDGLDLFGEVFTFRHLEGSGIRIRELTVTPGIVPLSAAMPMLLIGLGSLGVVANRRRKQS